MFIYFIYLTYLSIYLSFPFMCSKILGVEAVLVLKITKNNLYTLGLCRFKHDILKCIFGDYSHLINIFQISLQASLA